MNVKSPSISCVLCNDSSFVGTPFLYRHENEEIRIVRCTSCGLGRLHPMLTEDEVIRLYNSEYFERDYHCGLLKRSYKEEIENLRNEAKPPLSTIKQYARGKKFLEIGCAGGAMLAEAKERGFKVVGVEISPVMAEWGRTNLHFDIRTGTLEEQRFPNDFFDVVFLGDVIEHLLHPREAMNEIRRILSPTGIVALAYPMELNSIVPSVRRFLNLQRQFPDKPYHLFYYELKTMRMLLEQCGFHVVHSQEHKLVRRQSIRTIITDLANMVVTTFTGSLGDRGFTIARRENR